MKKLLFALVLFPVLSLAEIWKVNVDHSDIFFRINYLNISEVTGRFNSFSGWAELNDQTHQVVFVQIDSSTIETGNRLRDGHLKSSEFLKSKEFPYITFKSLSVTKLNSNHFKATGELAIGGVTKIHSLDFSVTDSVKDTWNYESKFVKFTTTINRRDYKLFWNKTLAENKYLIGEKISIWGTLQLQLSGHKTPSSKHMIPDTNYIRKREKIARGEIPPESAEKLIKTQLPSSFSPKKTSLEAPLIKKEVFHQQDIRERPVWRVSFWILGLMGFFASIIIGFYIKKLTAEKFSESYREGSFIGLITDSITIIFILAYVIALWEVGWG
jgi:polyisoprenoid-binding protein YceI